MCLVISKKFHAAKNPKPRKTRKDIEVFKVLRERGYNKVRLISPHKDFEWELDFVYYNKGKKPFEITYGSYFREYYVYQGLHAFRTVRKAKDCLINFSDAKIFKAIIPAGSLYFIGKRGDIVSNQLQVIKERVPRVKKVSESRLVNLLVT